DAGSCPTIGARTVSTASVGISAPPYNHFTARPYYSVTASASGHIGRACSCPTVCYGVVFTAGIQRGVTIKSTPDDHFTAGPHCSVHVSCISCVSDTCSCPTIRVLVVSLPIVGFVVAAPDDHFAASPHRRV